MSSFFFLLIESNNLTNSRGKSGIKSSSAPSNTKKEISPLPERTGRWPQRGALDGGGRQHGGGRGDGHAVVAVDRHVQTAVVHLTQALRGMLRGKKVEKGDGRGADEFTREVNASQLGKHIGGGSGDEINSSNAG